MKGEKTLYDETGFPTYRVEFEASTTKVEFKAFEVNGAYDDGEGNWVLTDQEIALEGYVKWDGCSNWSYATAECMAHYCGVRGLKQFFDMHLHLYELAAELMGELGTEYPADNREEFYLEDQ